MKHFLRTAIVVATLLLWCQPSGAHSGKARFHMIVDTDCAADDLRSLCMLLGNREVEVLAITSSAGALPTDRSAAKVRSLLREFHHEGIPVGMGRDTRGAIPRWRDHSEKVVWGRSDTDSMDFPAADDLIVRTIEGEDEKVIIVALGALTNIADVLSKNPAVAERIDRIVWYGSLPEGNGANWATDSISAKNVLQSGVQTMIVSASIDRPIALTGALLDSIAATGTVYADKIVETHNRSPLDRLVSENHLELWDDLAIVYLFAPQLFVSCKTDRNVILCTPDGNDATEAIQNAILAVLRGEPDVESRVFYGFPTIATLYAADVAPIIDRAIECHGMSEWRAGVLTNELHGHLGIYATIGVKMGIRAREYFNIGVDDMEVVSFAGSRPPVSCMNDGLQVSTGATTGHGLIRVSDNEVPRPEATFSFKGKSITLSLKPEVAARIGRDVRNAIAEYGDLTEAYWLKIRQQALQYWLDFDRHEIFDIRTTAN